MVHACNSRYSGSRDQVDNGSKLALANSFQDPISTQKKDDGVAQVGEHLSSKYETLSSKKKKTQKTRVWISLVVESLPSMHNTEF
jgi:hypothetical protein